jgi:hypothetical protein
MAIDPKSLTREQIRDVIRRQRAGYEQMENDLLREDWREPTDKEKIAFDEFMEDVLCSGPGSGDFDCGLVEWYRQLMRKRP